MTILKGTILSLATCFLILASPVKAVNYYLTTATSTDLSRNIELTVQTFSVITATNTAKTYAQADTFCASSSSKIATAPELRTIFQQQTTTTVLGNMEYGNNYWINTSSYPVIGWASYPVNPASKCLFATTAKNLTYYAYRENDQSGSYCSSPSFRTICTSSSIVSSFTLTSTYSFGWTDQVITPTSSNSSFSMDYSNLKYLIAIGIFGLLLGLASFLRKLFAR